jgi:hypothetical protein
MSALERSRLGGRHHLEIVAAGATMLGRCPGAAKLQLARRSMTYGTYHG